MNPTKRQNEQFSRPPEGALFAGASGVPDGGSGLSLNRLENVHAVNGKTVARCPACSEDGHDKTGDHLVIDAAGRFGCVKYPGPQGADHRRRVFALAGEVEARPQAPRQKRTESRQTRVETWPDIDTAAAAIKPRGFDLTDVYPYERGGAIVGWVCRYDSTDDKTFRQFHPEGGAVASGKPAEKWPLFLIDGAGPGLVFVVEGEKTTLAALSIGLNAACSAGGSGAAGGSDWTAIGGREIVILPDNDPAGEKYAATVAGILFGLGCTIRILRLPGLPEGGDLVEYLEANPNADAAQIEAMAAQVTPEAEPIPTQAPAAMAANDELQGGNPTEIKTLAQLENHGSEDPDCLLGERYLGRGGGLLFVAPTGAGKSTAIIQLALLWAVGKPAFGIVPKGRIRTLIVQAENDDGDLAEMRDGILTGMTEAGLLSEDQAQDATERVHVVRDVVSTGDEVGPAVDRYLSRLNDVDLVVLDPVFSYIGGETNSAKDVGHFLRNVINPVIIRRNVGFVAVHHSNKPLHGEQKQYWQAGDFAYLGAGSAEFANWARAVLAIRAMGSHDVFQLVAGKRGKRIGWRDDEGGRITERFIKHSPTGICWLDANAGELKADQDAADVENPEDALELLEVGELIGKADFTHRVKQEMRLGQRKAESLVKILIERGQLHEHKMKRSGKRDGVFVARFKQSESVTVGVTITTDDNDDND